MDGSELQAKLDAGEPIELMPGQVITIQETLRVTQPGQQIKTVGATNASEFATLRMADGSGGTLIDARGIGRVTISSVILDGNRYGFTSGDGLLSKEPMVWLGGAGAVEQVVQQCVIINSRCAGGWGSVHVNEGGDRILIENNLIFGSGTDFRGSGRADRENPWGMADGISTASRNTSILNNLILDAVDEGIMVQGAPGTVVKRNVIVAVSREMLGGIALVDPFEFYELGGGERRFNYKSVMVNDNVIVAEGARIHAALPLGGPTWTQGFLGTTLEGAFVRNNEIRGGALGYGVVANGIDQFRVTGNQVSGTCSGIGDGVAVDPAAPFLFDPSTVGTSRLQEEFVPMKAGLVGVLRSARNPVDSTGYRDAAYPKAEAIAVVRMAYQEMLGREPSEEQQRLRVQWLMESRTCADTLRRELMQLDEFIQANGPVSPDTLHAWRTDHWLKLILKTCSSIQKKGVEWPDAREWSEALFDALTRPSAKQER